MYLTQEKPYRPLLVALMFLTLPLAMILHNIVQIAFSDGQGLLVTVKDGAWAMAKRLAGFRYMVCLRHVCLPQPADCRRTDQAGV